MNTRHFQRTPFVLDALSLAPGFSRVGQPGFWVSRFNGWLTLGKPLKRFSAARPMTPG